MTEPRAYNRLVAHMRTYNIEVDEKSIGNVSSLTFVSSVQLNGDET